jgi:hypothetical protein
MRVVTGGGGGGQRMFYPQGYGPQGYGRQGYGQHPYFYASPGFGVGVGSSGAVFGRLTAGQVLDIAAQISPRSCRFRRHRR